MMPPVGAYVSAFSVMSERATASGSGSPEGSAPDDQSSHHAATRAELWLQHAGVAPVPAGGPTHLAGRREQPASVLLVAEERGEARAGIEAREAQPVDGPVAADEGGGLGVADERVVLDATGHRARSVTRVGDSAATSTASAAPGCVLLLERAHGYSFVVRPCQMTPLTRRNHQRTSDTDHYPDGAPRMLRTSFSTAVDSAAVPPTRWAETVTGCHCASQSRVVGDPLRSTPSASSRMPR